MARPISQQIKNLKGGISQQPENLRYPNQGDVQINCWSSEAEGLQKRPPSVFVKRLGAFEEKHDKAFFHFVNRDTEERYIMMFDGTGIRVFDLNGKEYTVKGVSSTGSYVHTAKPRDDIRAITVADYTFIVNRSKVVQEDTAKTHAGYIGLSKRAIVNVRGSQYGRTLEIKANGTLLASLKIADGDKPEHVNQTDAQWVVKELVKQVNGKAGWKAAEGIGHLVISRDNNADITEVTTSDGYAGTLLSSFISTVTNLNKLSLNAPNGYLVEVTGEVNSTGDPYWVMFDTQKGSWKETVAPNINRGINKNTMPHALIREADGTFNFRALDWTPRLCGNDETNPQPTFVGRTVNDVFYFRNRLGFLSDENVIMSRSGKYFDFYPASTAVLNDNDPVDIAVSHNKISMLKYAVPFSEQLLLWAEESQFVLTSNGATLTNRTVDLELTTEFYVSDAARPYGIDRGVYFVSPRASYSTIKRYYVIPDSTNTKSAEDVTAHVPNYLPNNIVHMQGSGTENFLMCLSDDPVNREAIFIYKYLYIEDELVQQAWSHWEFGKGTTVLTAYCIGSFMWVLLNRHGSLVLERIEFTKDTTDLQIEPYRTHIDMKVTCPAGTFDLDEYRTEYDLVSLYGFIPPAGNYVYIRKDGSFVEIDHNGQDRNFYLNGEVTEVGIFGKLYDMRYKFSKFLPKIPADDGSVMTEDLGRLQLSRAWVNYHDTGSFEMVVNNGSSEYRYPMGGGRYGNITVTIGDPVKSTGTMRYPVTGNALRQHVWIESTNPTPVSIVGCGWEGRLIKRVDSI